MTLPSFATEADANTQVNTVIRNETASGGITRGEVADVFQNTFEELYKRAVPVADITALILKVVPNGAPVIVPGVRGGLFVYDSAGLEDEVDNGVVFDAPTSGVFRRVYNGPVYLEWFGGGPSASAADNKTAIDKINSEGFKHIQFDEGTYSFTSGWTHTTRGMKLTGAGKNGTFLETEQTSGTFITVDKDLATIRDLAITAVDGTGDSVKLLHLTNNAYQSEVNARLLRGGDQFVCDAWECVLDVTCWNYAETAITASNFNFNNARFNILNAKPNGYSNSIPTTGVTGSQRLSISGALASRIWIGAQGSFDTASTINNAHGLEIEGYLETNPTVTQCPDTYWFKIGDTARCTDITIQNLHVAAKENITSPMFLIDDVKGYDITRQDHPTGSGTGEERFEVFRFTSRAVGRIESFEYDEGQHAVPQRQYPLVLKDWMDGDALTAGGMSAYNSGTVVAETDYATIPTDHSDVSSAADLTTVTTAVYGDTCRTTGGVLYILLGEDPTERTNWYPFTMTDPDPDLATFRVTNSGSDTGSVGVISADITLPDTRLIGQKCVWTTWVYVHRDTLTDNTDIGPAFQVQPRESDNTSLGTPNSGARVVDPGHWQQIGVRNNMPVDTAKFRFWLLTRLGGSDGANGDVVIFKDFRLFMTESRDQAFRAARQLAGHNY